MNDKNIEPNISLLTDHGVDGSFDKWMKSNKMKLNDPVCLRFDTNKGFLIYIGSLHTTDEKSSTYDLIKNVIKKSKPEIVVIEGLRYSDGLNSNISDFQGEGKYAGDLARSLKIDYIGIEEDNRIMLKELSGHFKISDIYGYIFMQVYKYVYKTMKSRNIQDTLNDFDYVKTTLLDKIFDNYDECANWKHDQWFKKTFNKPFKYGSYLEYSSPYCSPKDAKITQLISCKYSRLRDERNIKNLYKIINKYKKVVYVMGRNHVYADKNVLIDSFGPYTLC
jgi:hypothetical protein